MAMINCPECGKGISDLAESCPNCGFPMGINSFNTAVNSHTDLNTQQNDNPIVVVEHNQVKTKNHANKKKYSTIVICIFAFYGFIYVLGAISSTGKDNNLKNVSVDKTVEYTEYNENKSKNSQITEQKNLGEYIEDNNSYLNQNITYEDVFFYNLMDNIDSYNGKYVRTVVEVYSCNELDNNSYIRSQYTDYDLTKNYSCITIYPDNYSGFQEGEYITVEGRVAKNGGSHCLSNAYIVSYGDEAKAIFDEGKRAYQENLEILAAEYEANFKENATSPSYDDLMRYPDSYKEIQIKVNAKIVRVEPDGIIFSGDIEATMSGGTIALYDRRETKEPKLLEGDSVAIYGYGKGLTTIKEQDVSGWIPKTVNEYSIPAIDIKYIEFN